MYVCMYVRMYVRTYVRMYVCTYVRMYVRTYVCTYVRMYVCVCVCVYMCMCMCVTKLRVKDGVCESDVSARQCRHLFFASAAMSSARHAASLRTWNGLNEVCHDLLCSMWCNERFSRSLSVDLELFPRWAKVTTTEIRCSGSFFPRWAKTNRAARDNPRTTSLTALGFTKRVQITKIELEIELD